MSKELRILAAGALTVAALGVTSAAIAAKAPNPDSPAAVLSAAKSGLGAKLGPMLVNLSSEYKEAAATGTKAKDFKSANPALKTSGGTVAIDAYATNGNALVKSLRGLVA